MLREQQTSRIWRLNAIALWSLIATASIFAGLMLRDWTWKVTQPIRFQGDITNALNVGRETVIGGMVAQPGKPLALPDWPALWKSYLNRYDAEAERAEGQAGTKRPPNFIARYRFDYPPGRLLIASAWAKYAVEGVPTGDSFPRGLAVRYEDELVTPLRRVNIGHELAAALAMFFLVRRVFILSGRRWFVSEALAMLASLFVWFNPALILNAHGWPQWEAWVLPYTLWAAYFALIDCWMLAGVVLAAGAMLKGQVLMFAPIFPLWAIFAWRWGALLRLASGFFAGVAILMSPWLLRDAMPALWATGGAIAFAASVLLIRSRRSQMGLVASSLLIGWLVAPWLFSTTHATSFIVSGVILFLVSAVVTAWRSRPIWSILVLAAAAFAFATLLPASLAGFIGRSPPAWLSIAMPAWSFTNRFSHDPSLLKLAMGALCAIGGLAIVARRHAALPASLGMFAALVFIAAVAFNGSFAWMEVGFQTVRYDELFMGRVSNLPAILQRFHQLAVDTPVSTFGFLPTPMLLSPLLKLSAGVGLALCALAISIQIRRKDPNALIAFAAAWTLLYALLPQMHERYLTWGAVVSALLVTRGIGGLLAHVALTAIQFAMMLFGMATSHGRGEQFPDLQTWMRVFAGMQPSVGYIVVTIAFVLLCWSFRRSVPRAVVIRRAAVPQVLIRMPKHEVEAGSRVNRADTSPASA